MGQYETTTSSNLKGNVRKYSKLNIDISYLLNFKIFHIEYFSNITQLITLNVTGFTEFLMILFYAVYCVLLLYMNRALLIQVPIVCLKIVF